MNNTIRFVQLLIKLMGFTRALLNFDESILACPFLNHNCSAPSFGASFL